MRRLVPALALLAAGCAATDAPRPATFVPNPELPPTFRQLAATRPDGSTATLYLGAFDGEPTARKPLLVYCEGSGAQSLFARTDDGRIAYTIFGLLARHAGADWHVAAVEKRGVAFGEAAEYGTSVGASAEYDEHATLEDRVADVLLLLDGLLATELVDPSRVVLVGHSEGADVVAFVAARDVRVTHVACLSGGGALQFFDMLVSVRKDHRARGSTPEETEAAVEAMQDEIARVLADPRSTTAKWQGHAHRRWTSFASFSPADAFLSCDARVFAAHGSADRSVPVESFDYLVARLLASGCDATIRRYPGRDHSFIPVGAEPGYEGFLEVFDEVLAWAAP